jgi:hypothetical protein
MGYKVHVLVDPGNADCWANFKWVESVNTLPMELAVFSMFDHHAMFEIVSNLDEHTPQLHPVDSMLFKIGIDPKFVDYNIKSVAPSFTSTEIEAASMVVAGRRIGIYQLTAASRVRSLTPDESVSLLLKIANEVPDITWFAIYDGVGHSHVFTDMLKEHPANVVPYICPDLRVLWAIIDQSIVCISPDSMLVHVAGSLGKPCIGLWGPIGPETRMKYYRNHTPLFPQDACHMSPCHAYTTTFPKYCPAVNMPQCAVLSAISFGDVVSRVKDITKS